MKYELVIFDLDGTLLNTLNDLAAATNHALVALGLPTFPLSEYRYKVGNGVRRLLERALPADRRTDADIDKMMEHFKPYYDAHSRDATCPYPQMPELLSSLASRGLKLAVASNKYEAAVRQLVPWYFPDIQFSYIAGQLDGVPAKPNPAIVGRIAEATGVAHEHILYVGDSNVDMQTAKNAGVTACGVTWGFRPRAELEAEHPDFIVDVPSEIVDIVEAC